MINPSSNVKLLERHGGRLAGPEPILWVRRLKLMEELLPDARIVRDIQLRRGLNIVCTQTTPKNESKPRGHSVGKSLGVRLIRYCLGETSFFNNEDRTAIGALFPKGVVLAEVRLKGVTWVVARPIGLFSLPVFSFACACESIDAFLDTDCNRGKYSLFTDELESLVSGCFEGLNLPNSDRQARWVDVLGWISRDQQCRYRHHNEWRDPEAESGTGQLPKEDASLIIRMVMGLLDNKERELREKHVGFIEEKKRLEARIEKQKISIEFCEAPVRAKLKLSENPLSGQDLIAHAKKIAMNYAQLMEKRHSNAEENIRGKLKTTEEDENNIRNRIAVLGDQISTDETNLKAKTGELEAHKRASERESDSEFEADSRWCRLFVTKERAKEKGCPMNGDPPLKGESDPLRPSKIKRCEDEINAIEQRISDRKTQVEHLNPKLERTADDVQKLQKELQDELVRNSLERSTYNALSDDMNELSAQYAELRDNEHSLDALKKRIEKSLRVQEAERANLEKRLLKLNAAYNEVLSRVLGDNASGSIEIDSSGIFPRPHKKIGSRGEAMGTFAKVLGFDLGCFLAGLHGLGHHPLLMIHDSPREADMEEPLYHALFRLVHDMELLYEPGEIGFQYIVTTTTQPPAELNVAPWVCSRLHSREPAGLFLGMPF